VKLLLINPPVPHILRESLPPVVEDDTSVLPPLGLLYVAAYAEALPDWEVEIIDCQATGAGHENLASLVAQASPDVVGIQVMTFTLIDAALVAKTAKAAAPEALVVAGGPHPTLYPRETVALEGVDAAVAGEGEHAIQALLEAVAQGGELERLPNIFTTRGRGEGAEGPTLTYIKDMDGLLPPARHLLDLTRYASALSRNRVVTTMMSSRGCPGRCIFCDRPQMGKIFRKRSAQSVVDEMELCQKEYGIGEIIFYDDTFTMDRRRVLEICRLIRERGLELTWDIRARVDTMTPEMISALAGAGCSRIHYGVETGSPRLQKLIRKNLDLSQLGEVFGRTRREGIETLGYFMIGLPTETRPELEQTMDLMTGLPLDYAHVAVFTPYPGTQVYQTALAEGVYQTDYWREFALNPRPDFTPKYWNEHFSDDELLHLMKKAYARFYRRPGYILRRLTKVRSFNELWRKGMLGLKLLKEVSA
jgi:radical SAM superfamily enzyme YgiQ (UPF0313 family)